MHEGPHFLTQWTSSLVPTALTGHTKNDIRAPVLVTNVTIASGHSLTFQATGLVHFSSTPSDPPDGESIYPAAHNPENGIAALTAPVDALLGVFLDDTQPDLSAVPSGLNFASLESQTYTSVSPELKQVFLIGDGTNNAGALQQVVVPNGIPRRPFILMSRGDRREKIFLDDIDRHDFIKTLAKACQKTGWQVHSYSKTPDVTQIAQERLHFGLRREHLLPRGHPVKTHIRPHSVCVGPLGPDGVMLEPHHLPDLVQEFEFRVWG